MKTRYLIGLFGLASAVAITSLIYHPYGPVKTTNATGPLLAGAEVDRAVIAVLERSCQNCHSDKTEWPWYSYVAPASMMIESDVARARDRMNLSRWNEYSIEERQAILTELAAAIRSQEMPPAQYTFIHPQAKLSPADRELVYRWAREERGRLKTSAGSSLSVGGE